jgi:hypothetical protein
MVLITSFKLQCVCVFFVSFEVRVQLKPFYNNRFVNGENMIKYTLKFDELNLSFKMRQFFS